MNSLCNKIHYKFRYEGLRNMPEYLGELDTCGGISDVMILRKIQIHANV